MIKTVAESHKRLIERIAAEGLPADAEVIYSGRNTLYAVRDPEDGSEVCVKAFHCPRFPNSLVYGTLRKSKAERSYENARRLQADGFGTPVPFGYAEIRERGLLTRSYYFCSMERDADHIREWTRFPFCDELLSALAREMKRLHDAGIFMKDFSPGNVLFTRSPEGEFRFMYVDLNRMRFDVHDTDTLMRNFRAINLHPEQLAVLAAKYADAAGLPREQIQRVAQAQLDGYFAEKERNRRLKRIIKN